MAVLEKKVTTKESEEPTIDLLSQAIKATKQTDADRATDLIKTLASSALNKMVVWDKSLTLSINKAIKNIDTLLSTQVSKIMHNESFKKLEGSWRGLHHLVTKTETSINMLSLIHI